MSRVLRIINRLNLGGPTFNASILSRYLDPEFETRLLAGEKDDSEESSEFIAKKYDLSPQFVKGMKRELNPQKDYDAYQQIVQQLREFRPDVVHTHAAKAGALGRFAAAMNRVPVIIHTFHGHVFHSYFGILKTGFYLFLERMLAAQSTAIVAISHLQKHELSRVFKIAEPYKFKVVNLGFELDRFQEGMSEKRERFRQQYGLGTQEVAVGIIGRFVPIKNHRLFLESIAVARQYNTQIRAFLVGDGESRDEIIAICEDLDLSTSLHPDVEKPAVVFTSWIREVDYAMAGLDVVALTSKNEGTPVSLIEAQAASVPVVSTDVGGVRDVVLDGESGIVVPQDANELAKAFIRLAEEDELRTTMGQVGRDFAFKRFNSERLVEDIRQLYKGLLAQSKRKAV